MSDGALHGIGPDDDVTSLDGGQPTSLRVAVGNPFRAPGRTLVEVGPSGSVAMATFRLDKVTRDRAIILQSWAQTIVRAASEAMALLEVPKSVERVPDEALYLFELRRGAESVAGVVLPESMLERLENFKCLLRALDDVIARDASGRHSLGLEGLD